MDKDTVLKSAFVVAYICLIIGLVGKVLHFPYSEIILIIAIVAGITYAAIALMEIWPSKQIETTEKLMWTTGFIFLNGITGLLYLFNGRKRILKSPHSNSVY